MDKTGDLEAALGFVIGRIAEQARLSGEPLSEEQCFFLDNLPSASPSTHSLMPAHPEIVELVPRNINYVRFCDLAKAAYLNDRETNPASLDWEFAFAVFKLERHPMWGLLHLAGAKIYRRPLWDQLFVIIAALLPAIAVLLLASKRPQGLFQWAAIFCGCIATMLFLYFASQQIEKRQLENHLERCSLASRNISWKTG